MAQRRALERRQALMRWREGTAANASCFEETIARHQCDLAMKTRKERRHDLAMKTRKAKRHDLASAVVAAKKTRKARRLDLASAAVAAKKTRKARKLDLAAAAAKREKKRRVRNRAALAALMRMMLPPAPPRLLQMCRDQGKWSLLHG